MCKVIPTRILALALSSRDILTIYLLLPPQLLPLIKRNHFRPIGLFVSINPYSYNSIINAAVI